jgi:hypothetical protein
MSRELKKQTTEDVMELLRQGWILEHHLHPYVFDPNDVEEEEKLIESASVWTVDFMDRRTVNMNIFRAIMRRGVLEEVKRNQRPYHHGSRELMNTEIRYRLVIQERVHDEEIIGSNVVLVAAHKSRFGRRDWVVWRGKDGNQHAAPRTLETLKAAMLAHGTQNTFTCYNAGVGQLTDWRIANNMRRQIQMGYIS